MSACRGCGSSDVELFLPLGDHPPANRFLTEGALADPEPAAPLNAHVCRDCGLIQVPDNVPDGFFDDYVYVPSAADTMQEHFAALAESVTGRVGDGLVVDIGCNDGLFLAAVQDRGAAGLGVDPAQNIVARARDRGVQVVNDYFSPAVAEDIVAAHGAADAVVTTNTYHHIDDLAAFTRGVKTLLADDGVFIIEVPHALDIVEQHQFDGIYHEHVSQFTVKAIADHVARFGLRAVDVERISVHGGSIRVTVRHADGDSAPAPAVTAVIDDEADAGLFSAGTYARFRDAAEARRRELLAALDGVEGSLAGYGASARGNTLLNYCGIDADTLDFIADRNELKQGRYTPGSHIPIVGPEALTARQPDAVLLLAWNFAEEIVAQQAAYLDAGGRFILPFPDVRTVTGPDDLPGKHDL